MTELEQFGGLLAALPERNREVAAFRRTLFELSFGPDRPAEEESGLWEIIRSLLQGHQPFLQQLSSLNNVSYLSKVTVVFPRHWPRERFLDLLQGPGGIAQTAITLSELEGAVLRNGNEPYNWQRLHRIVSFWHRLLGQMKEAQKLLREEGRNPLKMRILGYGEISTVMKPSALLANLPCSELVHSRWVFKRMPIFPSLVSAQHYIRIYEEYRELLVRECGLNIPKQSVRFLKLPDGRVSLYALQEQLPPQGVCHKLLHELRPEQADRLFSRILDELSMVWHANDRNVHLKIALDGQVSNWALDLRNGRAEELLDRGLLFYLDTSTPLYRIHGVEQLDPEIFLKNSPSFLRWIIRKFFLQDVLDRYYDLRAVTLDAIANLYKEGLPELVPRFIGIANARFDGDWRRWNFEPLTEKEVRKYYREDAFIWRFFQASRRLDRFFTEKVLGRRYEFRLPGKIRR